MLRPCVGHKANVGYLLTVVSCGHFCLKGHSCEYQLLSLRLCSNSTSSAPTRVHSTAWEAATQHLEEPSSQDSLEVSCVLGKGHT